MDVLLVKFRKCLRFLFIMSFLSLIISVSRADLGLGKLGLHNQGPPHMSCHLLFCGIVG